MNKHLWKAYRFFQASQVSLLLSYEEPDEETCKNHIVDSVISEILMDEELEKYRAEILEN